MTICYHNYCSWSLVLPCIPVHDSWVGNRWVQCRPILS